MSNTNHAILANATASSAMLFDMSASTTPSATVSTITAYPGSTVTHSCWSAAVALKLATNGAVVATDGRLDVAGYTGGRASCLDHAVDGFSLWGAPIFYRIISNGAASGTLSSTATSGGAPTYAILTALYAFSLTTGDTIGGTQKGPNLHNVRSAALVITTSSQFYHCFVYTSIEYYTESAVVCVNGNAGTNLSTGTPFYGAVVGGILTKATYGSIWAMYPYDADGVGNIGDGTQTADAMVVVGTL